MNVNLPRSRFVLFLLVSVALAIIGLSGSVTIIAVYYHSSMVERTEKKRVADEYYFKDLHDSFTLYYESSGTVWLSAAEESKMRMHKDGYSYVEIRIMEKKARDKSYADCKERRKSAGRYEMID